MTRKYNMCSRSARKPGSGSRRVQICMACHKAPVISKHGGLCGPCNLASKAAGQAETARIRQVRREVLRAWKEGTLDWSKVPDAGSVDWPDEFLEEYLEWACAHGDNKSWGLQRTIK